MIVSPTLLTVVVATILFDFGVAKTTPPFDYYASLAPVTSKNVKNVDFKCPPNFMTTPGSCIGLYTTECETQYEGLKEGNLCVVIHHEPQKFDSLPAITQTMPKNVTIIADTKTNDNGFRRLTKSENLYVQDICGQSKQKNTRIAHGLIAQNQQFPWALEFLYICSAVLISQRHLLTAAHCVSSTKNKCRSNNVIGKTVQYGGVCSMEGKYCPFGSNMKKGKVRRVVYPSDFHDNYCLTQNDIAVVELEENIEFDDNVMPICLTKIQPDSLTKLMSLGFGMALKNESSAVLRYMRSNLTKIVNNEEIITRGLKQTPNATIIGSAVPGDSGGPVQCSYNGSFRTHLAGIHSRGAGFYENDGFLLSTYVPAFADWICQLTGVCTF